MPSARAYSSAAGSPLISRTMRCAGSASVTTSRLVRGHEMLRLERPEGQRSADQHQDGAVGEEAAVGVDVGAAEAEAVAGRAADHRDLAQGLLQRVCDELFAHGQPVDQQEGEAVAAGRPRGRWPPAGRADPGRRPGPSAISNCCRCSMRPVTAVQSVGGRGSRRRCCGRGSRSVPISPAVVQPTTGTPANRRPISAASTSRSYSSEQKKMTSAVSGCATPRGTPARPRAGRARTTALCGCPAACPCGPFVGSRRVAVRRLIDAHYP